MNYNILPFSLNDQHTPYEKLCKTSILCYFISQILKKKFISPLSPQQVPKEFIKRL